MTWGIAAAVVGGGLGVSLIGGAMQSGAEGAAARQRQQTADSFTQQQKGIFDQRVKDQADAVARENALKNEGFNLTAAKKSSDLGELLNIGKRYDAAGTAANVGTSGRLADIGDAQQVLHGAASLEAGGYADDERGRQAGFQGDATGVANNIINNLGVGRFLDQKATAQMPRNYLTTEAIGGLPGVNGSTSGVLPGGNDAVNSELAKQLAQRVGGAAHSAFLKDDVSSYGDASGIADRLIQRGGEQIGLLGRKAQTSEEALNPELAAANMVRTSADQDAATRKANATADLSSFVKVLQDAQSKETGRVSQRQQATNDLLSKFYDGSIQTEQDFANALNNSSLGYEDALKQLMNFKIGGTVGSSPLGQILSSAGGSAMGAGISRLLK